MTDTPNPFSDAQKYGPMISVEGKGEFICGDCGRRCTRGPSGVEYGHARGIRSRVERCPRRPAPEQVDPVDKRTGGDDG